MCAISSCTSCATCTVLPSGWRLMLSSTAGFPFAVTTVYTGLTAGAASVDYTTADGTAAAGVNYTFESGTLDFEWVDDDGVRGEAQAIVKGV